jgi:putative tryptophan/tyrosine transport system substrate-binding protein
LIRADAVCCLSGQGLRMRSGQLKRREFMTLVGGAAAWPLAAGAQQSLRRIAVIMVTPETDQLGRGRLKAFLQGIEALGWIDGRNVRIDIRWAGGSADRMSEIVTEFVMLKPDLIVANGTPTVAALKRATSTIPVVFVGINEPVAQGFVASMARPGGNITGFTQVEFSVVGKSVDMLRALAPTLSHVSLMYNPQTYGFYDAYLAKFQAEARWAMELKRAAVREPADIDVAITEIAARPDGALVVMSDAFNLIHEIKIRDALERHRLPHIVPWRQFVTAGGLMSYGPDTDDIFRRSADYVDRILRGTQPADLPVQSPTKYGLVINLGTAKALGIVVPPALLALADEVID